MVPASQIINCSPTEWSLFRALTNQICSSPKAGAGQAVLNICEKMPAFTKCSCHLPRELHSHQQVNLSMPLRVPNSLLSSRTAMTQGQPLGPFLFELLPCINHNALLIPKAWDLEEISNIHPSQGNEVVWVMSN